jgi:phenylalanyl-tRNA synthetase beta chain
MKISYTELKKFLDFDLSPLETAETLTFMGIETSVVSENKGNWTNVVTAKIISVDKHPNADKLSLCKVSDSNNIFSIVCGAPNVAEGAVVALAKIGAVLPGNFEIKKSKIRGIESEGMLCSQKELGLCEQSDGIMILDAQIKIGLPLEEIFKKNDAILEVEITPNRGDCLSYLGIARELAAKLRKSVALPPIKNHNVLAANRVEVKSDLCSRYIGAIISDVKVGPSPKWLSDFLENSGIRSINNIVDITNYVMLELGQPLHAFDMTKLSSEKVMVRCAKENEKITALDGKSYNLDNDMLVIADEQKPIAIAGVMGGEYSGIDDRTSIIFLESAVFNPSSVRKTSKKLKLTSDSSYRFERGIDPVMTETAALRAIDLILSIAGGVLIGKDDFLPAKYNKREITLRYERVRKILGYTISGKEIGQILKALGFDLQTDEDVLLCRVPSWRNDIKDEIDLIEEIVRLNGYENIPKAEPDERQKNAAGASFFPEIVMDFRKRLYELDFCEALNYSFTEISQLNVFGLEGACKIANPLSKENEILRPSLLPLLYKNLLTNIAQGADSVSLFEYGTIFNKDGEKDSFAFLVYGNVWDNWWKWEESNQHSRYNFYFAGGIIKSILPSKDFSIDKNLKPNSYYHPFKNASVIYRGKPIGHFGVLSPLINKDIKDEIVYFEIDIEPIKMLKSKDILFKPFAKFPPVKRDISVIADKSLPFFKIEQVVKNIMKTGKILKEYSLFSVYSNDKKMGGEKIAYSLRLLYRDDKKTLTDVEVNRDMQILIDKLEKEISVTLRN